MRQFWRARGVDGSPSASRNVASVPRRFMILGEVDLTLSYNDDAWGENKSEFQIPLCQ